MTDITVNMSRTDMPIHSRYQYPEKRKHHNFPLKYPATKTTAQLPCQQEDLVAEVLTTLCSWAGCGRKARCRRCGERLGVGDVGEKLSSVAFDCQITGHVK